MACSQDCEKPICSARIKAVPGCSHCRDCAEEAQGG
ncbi:MAG: TraR/DksA C4-type zinc finger protein [Proteobacteria bacterium]|nr:TraR/DksA C4-type zinc finger protein [Pseudomonadota bacterium]